VKKITIAILLSAFAAAPVFAADQGAYIAVDLGQVSYSNATSQFSGANAPNPNAIILGGGYHFSQYMGVEAGYSIIGDSTIDTSVVPGVTITEKLKASSFQVAAVGTFPINDMFNVFGKLGLANTKIDYSASVTNATFVPGVVTAASASKTNLMFGLGGQLNINQHFGIRLQYEDFGKVTFSNAPDVGVKLYSLGGVYNF
jgi:OOP family OmpA-OmpF porin